MNNDFLSKMAAHVFHSGLSRLEFAFEIAINGVRDAYIDQKMQRLSTGMDELSERDQVNRLHMETDILLSEEALCGAFIIAAYHFWEKTAIDLLGQNDKGFTNYCKVMGDLGGETLRLNNNVRNLVNYLKHPHKRRIATLYNKWPSIFSQIPKQYTSPEGKKIGSLQHRVKIDESLVRDVFSIIKEAGPTDDHWTLHVDDKEYELMISQSTSPDQQLKN